MAIRLLAVVDVPGAVIGLRRDTRCRRAPETSASTHAEGATDGGLAPPPTPLFRGWEDPAGVIVFSGEQHGYLEPCGCTANQTGGLARRADLFRQIAARNWPVVGLDLGGLIARDTLQSRMKLAVSLDALNQLGYRGAGLGLDELRLGAVNLFEVFSGTQADQQFDVPFLSANVTIFGSREAIGMPAEYRIVPLGKLRIGVTSVFGRSYMDQLIAPGVELDPSELKIDDPRDALRSVLPRMQAERPDLLVLLAYAKPEESTQLAQEFPGFQIVVTAGGAEDPVGEPEFVNRSMLLKVGQKGKNVGVVGLFPGAPAGKQVRFELVNLDQSRFEHAPTMDQLMERYQQRLKDEQIVASSGTIDHEWGPGYEFVGAEKCGECHTTAYSIWEGTKHAHGFESLTPEWARAHEDESMASRVRVAHVHDPECLCCHTTGWQPEQVQRYASGFLGLQATPGLAGNQCENCHGPGSRHVKLEESVQAGEMDVTEEVLAERMRRHITKEWSEEHLCIKCHDVDNSPHFDFSTYWPQIEHIGKD